MPFIHPFRALQFQGGRGDVSSLVAPPYDVLDAASKSALLARDARNIVAIDLPHTPAKELGPPTAYAAAAATYRRFISNGTLRQAASPAIFAYRQTTRTASGVSMRSGMAACVEAVPFGPRPGGGILPHEETFSGPKEDRLALMNATHAQISPIFGLHSDEHGQATSLLQTVMNSRSPDTTADMGDGVLHEVWTISDAATIRGYQDALANEDIFIADGHHRYTTQLNYVAKLSATGQLSTDHPARRCMMVLVGMSDPGLLIWPTHRVLGGMKNYSLDAFKAAAKDELTFTPVGGDIAALDAAIAKAPGELSFGVFDFQSRRGEIATPRTPDPLASRFPEKPRAWRELAVAYIQHVVVERICQPLLNDGEPVKWAFPHTIREVQQIGEGVETGAGGGKGFAQVALIVRPTPLAAVRETGRANQLMPQKSTFFYPKLATGLFINPLE